MESDDSDRTSDSDQQERGAGRMKEVALQPKDAMGEMIQFVRNHSAFYHKAWSKVPPYASSLERLPLTDVDDYWKASNVPQVMTTSFIDGVIMRSSGSTGVPKTIYVTRSELKTVTQVKTAAIAHGCGLIPGDRIANLSHLQSMYGSFIYFNTALLELPVPIVHLPIGGNESIESMANYMERFGATVLLSNVSTACRIADYLSTRKKTLPSIRLILYSGESFYKGLRIIFRSAFPNAIVFPVLYGSIDVGPIAVPALPFRHVDDDISPTYKVLSPIMILEIIAGNGSVIKQPGVKGHVVITHLVKRQQPMLRYPVGDIAAWVDYEMGTFKLHGRSAGGLNIGGTHSPLSYLQTVVSDVLFDARVQMSGFQTLTRRARDAQQSVTFRIAAAKPANAEELREKLEGRIAEESLGWSKNRSSSNIAPLQIEWVKLEELIFDKDTGKLRDIIEEQF